MKEEHEKADQSPPPSGDPWPRTDEWPEEAHAAAAFFASGMFLIQEGWNRIEDLGWVEAWGSDSQRAILNLDNLDPFSLRALSGRRRRS